MMRVAIGGIVQCREPAIGYSVIMADNLDEAVDLDRAVWQ
jgi:hypothetical protein